MSDGMVLLYIAMGLIVFATLIAVLRSALGGKKVKTHYLYKS